MTMFLVPDMSCGHCKAAISEALAVLDDAAEIAFDMERRTIVLSTRTDIAAVLAALAEAGYPATTAC